MVIAVASPLQQTKKREIQLSEDGLQLDLHLSLKLGITAKQAKRKLSRFLLDEVSLFIGPEEPILMLTDSTSALWRFPLQLAMARRGRIGQVGVIDIDAQTGEILLTNEQRAEIKLNAHLLARSAALPADA